MLEFAMSHMTYFGEIYLGIGNEVEESTALEIVPRCRTFYICRLEELRKMKEEAPGSSSFLVMAEMEIKNLLKMLEIAQEIRMKMKI
ncbi:hypothetical protein L2E82_07506 [Cichorium intybus]|uniref:Uncharacterized protein n=1 Tax=Cichorium intybus TaxID=13427 RepID=A0ACB9G5E1_CICIN|nr:hypothetical protein L2E82_07506 [Cichorium intybus]